MLGTHSTKVIMNFTIQGMPNHYEQFVKKFFREIELLILLQVTNLDIILENITISTDENLETAVVASGSKDGSVKIWWDGGRALEW